MNRIGLGCMGMARRNEESSIRTVDVALDHGVRMFNVGAPCRHNFVVSELTDLVLIIP